MCFSFYQLCSTASPPCLTWTCRLWRQTSCVSEWRIVPWVPRTSVPAWVRSGRGKRRPWGRESGFSCTLIMGSPSGRCGILEYPLKTPSWLSRKCSLWLVSTWTIEPECLNNNTNYIILKEITWQGLICAKKYNWNLFFNKFDLHPFFFFWFWNIKLRKYFQYD